MPPAGEIQKTSRGHPVSILEDTLPGIDVLLSEDERHHWGSVFFLRMPGLQNIFDDLVKLRLLLKGARVGFGISRSGRVPKAQLDPLTNLAGPRLVTPAAHD